jgi:hypothetical protein
VLPLTVSYTGKFCVGASAFWVDLARYSSDRGIVPSDEVAFLRAIQSSEAWVAVLTPPEPDDRNSLRYPIAGGAIASIGYEPKGVRAGRDK